MDKVFKVPSNQSDNITNSNNLLDFQIPEGQFDLSKSYVEIKVLAAGGGTSANITAATFNMSAVMDCENGVTTDYVRPISLVKNARLTSESMGRVEEARQVNELRLLLSNFEEHQSVHLGTQNTGLMAIKAYEQYGGMSPLIDANKEAGSSAAKYLEKSIKIPVSQIVNVGKSKYFDTSRIGRCNLNLELDRSRLSAVNLDSNSDYYNKAAGGLCNGVFVSDAGGAAKTSGVLGKGDGSGAKVYDSDYMEHIPFYIGQPVRLPAANNGTIGGAGIGADVLTVVNDITYNETNGNVTISVADSLGTGATDAIFIEPCKNADLDAATVSLTLNQANLVLHQIGANNQPAEKPSVMNYSVYSVENDSFGNTTSFKRQYEIEPEAINTVVSIPSFSNGILSSKTIDDHRVSVNNELTTDRNVVSYTPLYYHKLNQLGLNMDKSIQNVAQKRYKNNSALDKTNQLTGEGRGEINGLSAIYQPLPASQRFKLVEFEINDANDINQISIFKELIKSM